MWPLNCLLGAVPAPLWGFKGDAWPLGFGAPHGDTQENDNNDNDNDERQRMSESRRGKTTMKPQIDDRPTDSGGQQQFDGWA
mmetsp:Transcript_4562/g.6401  ORF Transcript_4562/g.6401 Transcript_4562/m.6401 type:complete len:82 (+) Transcript_4562:52-297(+)